MVFSGFEQSPGDMVSIGKLLGIRKTASIFYDLLGTKEDV